MIEVDSLAKSYRESRVLDRVTFEVQSGEHLLLTGPSGAGKSTLLRILSGLESPDAGRIRLNDKEATHGSRILIEPHRRGLSMVFQDLGLWPNLTALQNVSLGVSRKKGTTRSGIRETARKALDSCQVGHLADARPGRLSAGEQQRVALARALADPPRVLLLDEPFASLDLLLRESLFQLMRELIEEHHLTVITVSHVPEDAFGLRVDRIAVLESGRIMEPVTLEEFREGSFESSMLNAWKETQSRWRRP